MNTYVVYYQFFETFEILCVENSIEKINNFLNTVQSTNNIVVQIWNSGKIIGIKQAINFNEMSI